MRYIISIVLVMVHLGTSLAEVDEGKQLYINKIQKIHQAIGADMEELQLVVLKSLVADYINTGVPLKNHMWIRDLQLKELTASGRFKLLALMQCRSGISLYQLGGTMDPANLLLNISLHESRDLREYVSSMPSYPLEYYPRIDNGSNGTYRTRTYCTQYSYNTCKLY